MVEIEDEAVVDDEDQDEDKDGGDREMEGRRGREIKVVMSI